MQLLILCHEQFFTRGITKTGGDWIPLVAPIDLSTVYGSCEMEDKAYYLALIRLVLGHYAAITYARYSPARTEPRPGHLPDEVVVALAHKWLQQNDRVPYRMMRLFVLKHLHYWGGHTELQNALMRPPLSEAPWLTHWLKEHDTAFERFVGASVLPKWDPFGEMGSYHDACKSVHKFVLTNGNDVQALHAYATRMHKDAKLLGGFALALASEAGIQRVHPVARQPQCLPKLHDWIQSASLQVSQEVRNLLLIFAGATQRIAPHRHLHHFLLNAESTGEVIFQYRFLAHVFAACISAGPKNPMRFFANWLLQPQSMKDTWMVGGEQDLRDMLQQVLQGEEGYSTEGSRFFQCQNGHQYYIGNCGRAFVTAKCPECGEVIGGGGHVLARGNIQMSKEDKSPPGYTFPPVKAQTEQEMYDSRRNFPPASYRCMRTILHAVSLLGVAARSGTVYEPLFTKTHTNLCGSEAEWFCDHFDTDWRLLKKLLGQNVEEMSKILHDLLSQFMRAEDCVSGTFSTLEQRNAYEHYVEDKFLKSCFAREHMDKRLIELNATWRSVEGPFLQELTQAADVEAMTPDMRNKNEPLQWCFTKQFDFAVLSQSLYSTPNAAKRYPVLTTFVRDAQKFASLRHLSGILVFQQLLSQRYSRNVTRSQARELTFAKIYASLPSGQKSRWRKAFASWQQAWNAGFSSWIRNWECLELPPHYRALRMDEHIALAFLLPAREDEGICPLVLLQAMVECHNGFIETVVRGASQKSSRVVDDKDVLDYTIERLLDFCNESAVSLTSGSVDCDLDKVEHHLTQIFASKPMINLELKLQQFAFQEDCVGISSIGRKLPQVPLKMEVASALQRDIRDRCVLGALQQCLKTTVSFLSRTLSHSLHADHTMLLSEYWREVLAVAEPLPSHTAQTEIRLCPLDAVWN